MTDIETIHREIERNKSKERTDRGVTWVCPNPGARPDTLARMAEAMLAALDALAKLGNGDSYGNSTGNVMAQEVLAECAKIAEAADV